MTRTAGLLNDIQTYHTMADQAGRVANEAGVKLLVMTHLTPPLPDFFAGPAFMSLVAKQRSAATMLGYDGLMVSLPSGSDSVDVSSLR
jgi:ribonuclease Z